MNKPKRVASLKHRHRKKKIKEKKSLESRIDSRESGGRGTLDSRLQTVASRRA